MALVLAYEPKHSGLHLGPTGRGELPSWKTNQLPRVDAAK